jgi:hypothetical protein
MKKIIPFLCLFLLAALPVRSDVVRVLITITNTPANGNTLVLNGVTKTWTNAIAASTATLIQTTNSIGASATNLFLHLGLNPYSSGHYISRSNNNLVAILGNNNEAMIAAASGWGTITYLTNLITNQLSGPLDLPIEKHASSNRVTWANYAIDLFKFATNVIGTNVAPLANYSTLTTGQTLSNKTVRASRLEGSVISNSTASLTSAYIANGALLSPALTNAVNYGDPLRSPGGGVQSEQFGFSASAATNYASAFGSFAQALGIYSSAFGTFSAAPSDYASAFGFGANAGGTNSTALGSGATANENGATAVGLNATVDIGHFNSTAIGYGAATTTSNQIMLGTAAVNVQVNNNLQVGNTIQAGSITNSTFTGTNQWTGDIAIPDISVSGLANTNNVIDPANGIVLDLSGPTANFNVTGILNGRIGRRVKLRNKTGFTIRLSYQSGTTGDTNRIETGTGGDLIFTNQPSYIELQYKSSRWEVSQPSN